MPKRACLNAAVVLGGHDISDWVSRWSVTGVVGEMYTAEIDVLVDRPSSPLAIVVGAHRNAVGPRGMTGAAEVCRVTTNAEVLVNGTDIADHVTGWQRMTMVGEPDVIRLFIHADEDVLTINGTAPWADNRQRA